MTLFSIFIGIPVRNASEAHFPGENPSRNPEQIANIFGISVASSCDNDLDKLMVGRVMHKGTTSIVPIVL